MTPRFLFVRTYYPEFLKSVYADDPGLADQPYDRQLAALFDTGFGVGDAYSHELRRLNCEAREIICNADAMQTRWAFERGIDLVDNLHHRRRQIVAAQIAEWSPDVLYVFEWCPLGDAFLGEVKDHARLLIGQVASPLHADRTYAAFDLMLSSFPPLIDHFHGRGMASDFLRLGFDERVLERVRATPAKHDVTFVGGLAPSHPDRVAWIETVLREAPVEVFGYGWEAAPPGSAVHRCLRGEVWGWAMYRTLAASRLTLNRHARIDVGVPVSGTFANNMRLYEATGVGTCLITERATNLASLFDLEREVVTYNSSEECAARIKFLLDHDAERLAIARAGQKRTLAEHTYRHRMAELLDIVRAYL